MRLDESGAGKLRRWLCEKRLSQGDLAAMMGITQTCVSRWCSGVARPRWNQFPLLVRITRGYVAPNDFMIEPSPPEPITMDLERETTA